VLAIHLSDGLLITGAVLVFGSLVFTNIVKSKPMGAVLSLLLWPVGLAMAIRLAKPGSLWFRENYVKDGHQARISITRFPAAADRHDPDFEIPDDNITRLVTSGTSLGGATMIIAAVAVAI
jgi:hypothetical protein